MLALRRSALIMGALVGGSVLAGASALAAPPSYNWTGFYIGANAGMSAASFKDTWSDTSGVYSVDYGHGAGFSGGGQAGFNVQMPTSSLVAGIEADFQGSTLNGAYADYGPDLHFGTDVNWWGTVRGRLGSAIGNFLPYVTGGLAYGNLTNYYHDTTYGPTIDTRWSTSRLGWTVGGGLEAAVTHNVSLRVEYFYTDLGSWNSGNADLDAVFPASAPIMTNVDARFSTFRVGVDWKLN